jgi:hypothetical protein
LLKAENEELTFGELAKKLAEQWKALDAEEKQEYEQMAAAVSLAPPPPVFNLLSFVCIDPLTLSMLCPNFGFACSSINRGCCRTPKRSTSGMQ